jgi:hypothetical protein
MTPRKKPRINVRSFDFDGCIFNWNSLKYHSGWEGLVLCNDKLLNSISAEIKKESFDEVIVMSGSLRQSYLYDRVGSIKNSSTSSFGAMKTIATELSNRSQQKCCLDKFLLVDLFNDHYAGYSFALAVDHEDNPSDHPALLDSDDIKFSILYSQMHKLASENPDAEIVYDFYDDRIDILTALQRIFTKYPDLIPPGVTANLHQYKGGSVADIGSFSSSKDSKIDYNYRHNIKNYLTANAGSFHRMSMAHIEKFKKGRAFINEPLRESAFDVHEHATSPLGKPYGLETYMQKQEFKKELTAYITLCQKEEGSVFSSLASFFSPYNPSHKMKVASAMLTLINKIEDSKDQFEHKVVFTPADMDVLLESNSRLADMLHRYSSVLPASFLNQKKKYDELECEKLIKKIENNIQVNLTTWS